MEHFYVSKQSHGFVEGDLFYVSTGKGTRTAESIRDTYCGFFSFGEVKHDLLENCALSS